MDRAKEPERIRKPFASETINGWVARDEDGCLHFFEQEPHPEYYEHDVYGSYDEFWVADEGESYQLDNGLIPDLTYQDGPQEMTIVMTIIKKETYRSRVLNELKDVKNQTNG